MRFTAILSSHGLAPDGSGLSREMPGYAEPDLLEEVLGLGPISAR